MEVYLLDWDGLTAYRSARYSMTLSMGGLHQVPAYCRREHLLGSAISLPLHLLLLPPAWDGDLQITCFTIPPPTWEIWEVYMPGRCHIGGFLGRGVMHLLRLSLPPLSTSPAPLLPLPLSFLICHNIYIYLGLSPYLFSAMPGRLLIYIYNTIYMLHCSI